MKTKAIYFVKISLILLAAVAVSYLISRPNIFVPRKSVPMFVGQEILKAAQVAKVKVVPVPAPKVVVPLPIFPPKVSFKVLPQYPASALQQGLGGAVLLSVYIGANGSPGQVQVKTSSGIAELDKSAVAAVSQWRFEPASQGGRAIASWYELPIRFEVK